MAFNGGILDILKQCGVKTAPVVLLWALLLVTGACNRKSAPASSTSLPNSSDTPNAIAPAGGNKSTMMAVRFLEDRVKDDPDDIVALNKLSGYYLQLNRETEEVKYLRLALSLGESSLRVLPADQNLGGLRALAQAEYETHDFRSARDHAKELTEYEPRRGLGFQLLGDASLELGDYDAAIAAYKQMEQLDPGAVGTETRLAHLALLRGDAATAQRRYANALTQSTRSSFPSAETIAWCHWQLGEVSVTTGDYKTAERHYRDALEVFADYPHAVTSLARLRAFQGDLVAAIATFEELVRKYSDPIDGAALGDLYKLAGRDRDAQKQYSAVERWSQQSPLHSALYNRHLALFLADHNLKADQAYALARKEYETRRDVYGADALAWAALKAGKLDEAQAAMKDALRLGTEDARFFYHAGMIARAAGDRTIATGFLRRAITLNPHFDLWQAKIAREALEEASSTAVD
ncbi:MAG: tetratricopeptide repeat protein [Pyrinomonadaceae bacterium]|nr:tetratricopeptide repeat protein [Pyrinomonadaceae bacterium]